MFLPVLSRSGHINRPVSQGTFTLFKAQGLGRAEAILCSGRTAGNTAETLLVAEAGVMGMVTMEMRQWC